MPVGVAALWAAMVVCYLVWILSAKGGRHRACRRPCFVADRRRCGSLGLSAWAEDGPAKRGLSPFYGDLPALTADARRDRDPRGPPHGDPGVDLRRPGGLTDTLLAAHRLAQPASTGFRRERWALLAELLDADCRREHLLFMFGAYRARPGSGPLLLRAPACSTGAQTRV